MGGIKRIIRYINYTAFSSLCQKCINAIKLAGENSERMTYAINAMSSNQIKNNNENNI